MFDRRSPDDVVRQFTFWDAFDFDSEAEADSKCHELRDVAARFGVTLRISTPHRRYVLNY